MKYLFFAVVFSTGFCSLGFQVIWQKYMSIMVGSEARSSTLVISIFLLGLSIGYYLFGKLSEKQNDRKKLLKSYGYIELITGAYGILFPQLFNIIFHSPLADSNSLLIHIFLTCLLCLGPTILMGATIPIMTKVLPEESREVNSTHSFIYGLNTLGAFLGVLVVGLIIIPEFGYELSVINLGFINVVLSLPYVFNQLAGDGLKQEDNISVENSFDEKMLFALGMIAGLVTLSLEVLWFRVLALSIGNSYLVFPMILSIFILAIGLGSLSLKKVSLKLFRRDLILLILLVVGSSIIIPNLAFLFPRLRVMFIADPYSFSLYHSFIYLFLLLILFPGLFFLGRMLPYSYAFLKKNKGNYGLKCGFLYFLNTVGTFFGALVFSYLLLYIIDIDTVYKILLILLLGISNYFFWKMRNHLGHVVSLVLLLVSVLYSWPREGHFFSLFRIHKLGDEHRRSISLNLNLIRKNTETLFFEDGPNNTTAVVSWPRGDGLEGDPIKAIFINNKSDSNTIKDFGTIAGLALYPYLSTSKENMNASLIGVGTGVTAGLLADFERISHLDVIEISPTVIDAQKFLSPENRRFYNNPKVKIHELDAFRFFRGKDNSFDLIVSEPTNPWINGVENLYTGYYYELIAKSLKNDGVLAQWLHTYSINQDIFYTVLNNLKKHFKNVRLIQPIEGDLIFIATNNEDNRFRYELANEDLVKEYLKRMHFHDPRQIDLLEVFNDRDLDIMNGIYSGFTHELLDPHLGRKAYRAFYGDQSLDLMTLQDPYLARLFSHDIDYNRTRQIIEKMDMQNNCAKETYFINIPCEIVLKKYRSNKALFLRGSFKQRIDAYSYFRTKKMIPANPTFLSRMLEQTKGQDIVELVFRESLKDGDYAAAEEILNTRVDKNKKTPLERKLKESRENYQKVVNFLKTII